MEGKGPAARLPKEGVGQLLGGTGGPAGHDRDEDSVRQRPGLVVFAGGREPNDDRRDVDLAEYPVDHGREHADPLPLFLGRTQQDQVIPEPGLPSDGSSRVSGGLANHAMPDVLQLGEYVGGIGLTGPDPMEEALRPRLDHVDRQNGHLGVVEHVGDDSRRILAVLATSRRQEDPLAAEDLRCRQQLFAFQSFLLFVGHLPTCHRGLEQLGCDKRGHDGSEHQHRVAGVG